MNGKIVFRILAGFLLIGAVAGVGFIAFNAGAATHFPASQSGSGQAPYPPFGYGYWLPFPFFGLGCFAPLLALFLLFVALRAMSFVFWGTGWRHWGRMHHARWGAEYGDENGVPPMFKEFHDRVHGKPDPEK